MSTMPPIATQSVRRNEASRCAITGREQVQQTKRAAMRLFDHVVGLQLQGVGHLDAQCSGRLQVDGKLEFGRLHDRHLGGLPAVEDLTGVDPDLTIIVQKIGPVAHQPASFRELATGIDRGHRVTRRQREELYAATNEYRIWSSEKSICPFLHKARKGRVKVTSSADGQ